MGWWTPQSSADFDGLKLLEMQLKSSGAAYFFDYSCLEGPVLIEYSTYSDIFWTLNRLNRLKTLSCLDNLKGDPSYS